MAGPIPIAPFVDFILDAAALLAEEGGYSQLDAVLESIGYAYGEGEAILEEHPGEATAAFLAGVAVVVLAPEILAGGAAALAETATMLAVTDYLTGAGLLAGLSADAAAELATSCVTVASQAIVNVTVGMTAQSAVGLLFLDANSVAEALGGNVLSIAGSVPYSLIPSQIGDGNGSLILPEAGSPDSTGILLTLPSNTASGELVIAVAVGDEPTITLNDGSWSSLTINPASSNATSIGVNNSDGTSQNIQFSDDGSVSIVDYSGPNGTGIITSVTQQTATGSTRFIVSNPQSIPVLIQSGFGLTLKGPSTLVDLSTNTAYSVNAAQGTTSPGTVFVFANGAIVTSYPSSDGIYQAYIVNGQITLLGSTIPGSFPPTPFVISLSQDVGGGIVSTTSSGDSISDKTTDIIGGNYDLTSSAYLYGSVNLHAGATLQVDAALGPNTNINFADEGTTLNINDPSSFGEPYGADTYDPLLENFLKGDVINLTGLPYVAGMMSLTYSAETGLLQVTNGTQTATLNFGVGNTVVDDPFHLAPDGSGGTTLTNDAIRCYCRGTMILTDRGEAPVECLAIGDLVMTHFGGLQPIKWIGRQNFGRRFAKNNRALVPVRIEAGALDDGLPARDLYVTPGHSMFLEDRLVLAKSLINGVTILQDKTPEEIHYYHLELASHDCVLAEGAWSESYADSVGMRNQFHNSAEFDLESADYVSPQEPVLCAKRPRSGSELEAVLRPIVARASARISPGRLRGWIDGLEDEQFIRGWAQDDENLLLPVLLEIRLDDKALGTVLACDERGDLVAAGIGNGQCSFRFRLPQPIEIEEMWRLTVRRVGNGACLALSHDCQIAVNNVVIPHLAA